MPRAVCVGSRCAPSLLPPSLATRPRPTPTRAPQAYKGTVLAITHDRYFLDNVAGWILEVDRGAVYPHYGNYSSWLLQKVRRARGGG